VHVDPDVSLVRDDRLTGVDPDSHPDGAFGERELSIPGRCRRIRGPAEGDEERVALRVDLHAGVCRECSPELPSVIRQHVRIRIPQLAQHPRRPLDVREEERDGAGREIAHAQMIVR
jgi:hypothetical protein